MVAVHHVYIDRKPNYNIVREDIQVATLLSHNSAALNYSMHEKPTTLRQVGTGREPTSFAFI